MSHDNDPIQRLYAYAELVGKISAYAGTDTLGPADALERIRGALETFDGGGRSDAYATGYLDGINRRKPEQVGHLRAIAGGK